MDSPFRLCCRQSVLYDNLRADGQDQRHILVWNLYLNISILHPEHWSRFLLVILGQLKGTCGYWPSCPSYWGNFCPISPCSFVYCLVANSSLMCYDCSGTGDSPCPTAKEGVSSDDVSRDVGAHESGPGIHGTRFDKNLVHSCGTFSTLDCLFELAMPRWGLIQDLSWMWNAPFVNKQFTVLCVLYIRFEFNLLLVLSWSILIFSIATASCGDFTWQPFDPSSGVESVRISVIRIGAGYISQPSHWQNAPALELFTFIIFFEQHECKLDWCPQAMSMNYPIIVSEQYSKSAINSQKIHNAMEI